MTLSEVRSAIEGIDSFYSEGVAFEGSMARCSWEVGVDIESESDESAKGEPEELPQQEENKSDLKSYWSRDSDSEMAYTSPSAETQQSSWMDYSSCGASWGFDKSERSCSPSPPPEGTYAMYDAPRTPPSTYSPLSARSSLPVTPEGLDIPMEYRSDAPRKPLRVDTDLGRRRFFEGGLAAADSESIMQTAVESSIYDPFAASSFFLASPPPASAMSMAMPSSVNLHSPVSTAKDVASMSSWDYSADEEDDDSSSSPSISTGRANSILELDEEFDVEDMIVSPDAHYSGESSSQRNTQPRALLPAFTLFSGTASSAPASSTPFSSPSKKTNDDKAKSGSLFSSIFTFPRSPRTSAISIEPSESQDSSVSEAFIPMRTMHRSPSPSSITTSWHMRSSPKPTTMPLNIPNSACRQDARILRSKRHWFSPGKLFATGAS